MWLEFGTHCRHCTNGKCVDPPTPQEPWEPPTVEKKFLHVTECPNKFCGDNARMVLRLIRQSNRGIPPVAGGTLDQTQQFVAAMDYVEAQRAECRRILKIPSFNA